VRLLYPTLGALVILAIFTLLIGRQNRDLLRVRAYRDFFLRLIRPSPRAFLSPAYLS